MVETQPICAEPGAGATQFDRLPDLLTPQEVAGLLRVSRNTVYEMIHRRQIPARRLGRKLLIAKSALIRLLADEG